MNRHEGKSTRDELTCKELVELVTDYLEGALSPTDTRRFEEHLATCTGCTRYVEQMRQTIQITGQLREESLSEEARTNLLAAFRDWKADSSDGE